MSAGEDLTAPMEAFAFVQHPHMRAWLSAFARCGNKLRASEAAGVDRSTPYTVQWRDDPDFQAGLEVAERMAAELLEREALRRAVEGVQSFKFSTKTGEPLFHPTLCRCGHHDHAHDGRVPGHRISPDDEGGPCLECSCEGFRRAPYVEHAYSDSLLHSLLKAYSEPFRDRIEIRGLMGKIDFSQLPSEAIERIAGGEHPLAVLASMGALALPPIGATGEGQS